MKHQIFEEEIPNSNRVKKYVVITDFEDKERSHENAIKYAASYVFKTKSDVLTTRLVYLTDVDADLMYFNKEKGTRAYIAVYRK